MSRLTTSFVLGYHGCDRSVGLAAINGKIELLQSDTDYDWLGPGAYFWESDPLRALEWAEAQAKRRKFSHPYVIGAVIDLRNCLDLSSREDIKLVSAAYESLVELGKVNGRALPVNKSVANQPNSDRVLRFLDCAVIKRLHEIIETQGKSQEIEPFDTVRGMFTEGGELYPTSGFNLKTHVQIAVLNFKCIRGLFIPCPYPEGKKPTELKR